MKKLVMLLGRTIHFLAWPFWLFYFRFTPPRAKVFVVHNNKLLLVKGWISKGKWSLPGGGSHRGEDLTQAASRELYEELGIISDPNDFELLGSHVLTQSHISTKLSYFLLNIDDLPEIKKQLLEIADSEWFDKKQLTSIDLGMQTLYGFEKYSKRLGLS